MIESTKMIRRIPPLIVTTVFFYGIAFMAPHKTILFGLSFVYIFVLLRLLGTLPKALTALYFTLAPFIVGKLFPIDLITERDLNIPGRTFGIAADVVVTVNEIIILCMAVFLIARGIRGALNGKQNQLLELGLFLYPVGFVIATALGSVRPEISFIHSVYALRAMILYFFIRELGAIPVKNVITIFSAGVFLELFLVVAQMVRGGSLGSIIEPIANFVVIDLSRDAAGGLLRFGGTYMHANALAHAMLTPFVLLTPFLFKHFRGESRVPQVAWFCAGIVLSLTMSRSAWFAAGVAGAGFLYIAIVRWCLKVRMMKEIPPAVRAVIAFVATTLIVLMAPRIASSFSSGGSYGSLETRILLLKEYTETIRSSPYFGVGLEMDVYVQYLRSAIRGDWDIDAPNRSVLLYFPEPVHNGFLRLLVQVGLVGMIPYLFLYTFLIRHTWRAVYGTKTVEKQLLFLSLICLHFAVGINSFMQPILPDISFLTACTVLYLQEST